MERVLSPEERLRRAEEIYYRRQMQGVRVSTSSVNIRNSNKISLGKKMIVQILISVVIYCGFITIKNYKSVFSDNFLGKTKEVLNYDVNFIKMYNQVSEYFNNQFNSIIKKNKQNGTTENKTDDNQSDNNETDLNNNESNSEENNNEQNVENNVENGSIEENKEENENNTNTSETNSNEGIRRWNRCRKYARK